MQLAVKWWTQTVIVWRGQGWTFLVLQHLFHFSWRNFKEAGRSSTWQAQLSIASGVWILPSYLKFIFVWHGFLANHKIVQLCLAWNSNTQVVLGEYFYQSQILDLKKSLWRSLEKIWGKSGRKILLEILMFIQVYPEWVTRPTYKSRVWAMQSHG